MHCKHQKKYSILPTPHQVCRLFCVLFLRDFLTLILKQTAENSKGSRCHAVHFAEGDNSALV